MFYSLIARFQPVYAPFNKQNAFFNRFAIWSRFSAALFLHSSTIVLASGIISTFVFPMA
jgi:hypothetical protein